MEKNIFFLVVFIEWIEIICGLVFILYGFDVMGGVINIIIKKVMDVWIGNVELGIII